MSYIQFMQDVINCNKYDIYVGRSSTYCISVFGQSDGCYCFNGLDIVYSQAHEYVDNNSTMMK